MSFKLFLEDRDESEVLTYSLETLNEITTVLHDELMVEDEDSDYFASFYVTVQQDLEEGQSILGYISEHAAIDLYVEEGEEYAYDYAKNIVYRSSEGSLIEDYSLENTHTIYIDFDTEDENVDF